MTLDRIPGASGWFLVRFMVGKGQIVGNPVAVPAEQVGALAGDATRREELARWANVPRCAGGRSRTPDDSPYAPDHAGPSTRRGSL